ncbi:MAG: DNA repair protein RadC, partial [Patescibacteria group bacterium]
MCYNYGMKIKDLPKVELPREKLEKYGQKKLLDHELLAILLGSGVEGLNVIELAKKILKYIQKESSDHVTLEKLREIHGLGAAKACQILAMIELASRLSDRETQTVLSAEDVWKISIDIRDSKKEHVVAFYLDSQGRVIERQTLSIGSVTESSVHPREIFEPAVRLSAVSVVLVHNHPSGVLTPSPDDMRLTERIREAGKILGIPLADHVIISKNGHQSIK